MEIKFGDIGRSLGTRFLGQQLRVQIEDSFKNNQFVEFNFEGVDLISHSFADECFGKLLLNFDMNFLKVHSTFTGISPLVKKTIVFVLKERAANSLQPA